MSEPPNLAGPRRMELVSMACGALVALVGVGVLAAWQFDLPVLKSVLSGAVTMKANTALAFLLAGFALLLLSPSPVSFWRARAGRLLALLVVLIGAAALLEYVSGWNLAIDEFLFREDPAAVATASPGRMALTTALNFLLLGLSLLLIDYEPRKGFRLAEALVPFPSLVSVTTLVEYLHGSPILLAFSQYTRMALHTAATFLLLAAGVLLARPALGFLGEIRAGRVHRTERRVYLTLVLSLAVLVAIGIVSIHNANDSVERSRRVEQSHQVRTEIRALLSAMQDISLGVRGFLLTGDDRYLQPYQEALDKLETRHRTLASMIADNPAQTARLRQFELLSRARVELARRSLETWRAQGAAAALPLVATGKRLLDSMREIAEQMDAEEARLLSARRQEDLDSAARMNLSILFGSGFALGIVAFAGIALHQDFVLRKRVEDALRRAEQEARRALSLLDATRDGVFIFLPDRLLFTYVNQGAVDQVGYSREELLRMTPLDIKPEFDEPRFRRMLAPLLEGSLASHTFTTVHRRKDGALVPVEIVLQCVAADGEAHYLVALVRDITERKRAEEEQNRLFTLSRDMIGIAGFDGYFKRVNPAWEETLGFTAQEITSSPFLEFVHPDDRESTLAEFANLTSGLETISFENRYRCKDGSYKWLLWSSVPSVDRQLIYAVAHDITDRKRAEAQLRRLNTELEERARALETANKELEAFTYSVSHDLRAPLRHVDGYSKILAEEFAPHLPAEGQRMIERIRTGARQAGQLVDDLLNLSRVGRRELNLEIVGLKTVVEDVVKDLAEEAQGRQIEWRVGELPFVECDAALIKQVLANLLGNAVKYTRPRPQAVIEVGTRQHEGQPVVFVRDNGIGFSMKYADKLFGVFQRLHRAEDFEGTGVGLATVQRIVHKHGGRVWAEAELDKGATFSFTLGQRT